MRTRSSSSPRPLSFSLARLTSALAVAAVLGSGTAAAQNVFWDPLIDGDGLLGGTGTWNLTNTFWDPTGLDAVLPDNVAWPNTATSIGVFAGTPGTATINTGTGVTANGLTFNVSNYLIASNVAADVLTLAGTTPAITVTNAGTTARINSVIAGTAGLTTAGAGALVLSGANTFSGQMTIGPGSIVGLNTATALGANGLGNETIVQAGGMLNIGGQSINNNPPPATPGEEIRIAGTGVGGLGALINTSAGNTNTLAKVVLTADATIGAGAGVATSYGIGGNIVTSVGGRTDIRVNAAPTVGQKQLDLAGFTLTKAGSHLLALVNAEVSDGNIIVNDGQLNFEAGTLVQGTGLITVNPGGKLGFWSSSAAGNITRPIVVNGGTIGDPTATGAAQTINAPINFTGALNPNFTSVSGNVTTLAGVISQAGFTGTELAKRGSGVLAFSNPANAYTVPNSIYQGSLRGNFTTALPAGGVAPAAPLTTTDVPLGTNPTFNISGGTLSLRINMANDNTNQRWDLGRAIVVDRAPGTMDFDRLSNAAQVDKNVVVSSLTFAAPSAANGYSVGQNQLTFNQGNTHRLEIAGMTMNSDTVLTTGDFTISGNAVSPGRHSLVHSGGNSWGFIDGTAQQFNAVLNLGAANLRIGSMFGTGVINDTVTAGTGPIYNAPNNVVAFRSPTNIAPGQTVELFSHRTAHSTVNLQNFTTVPASLRALNSGVLGVGSATAFGDIDLSKLGDGTFRIGSGLGGTGNGTIVGVVQPGAGGIVRTGAAGTTLLTAPNAISGNSILEVGSDLINGGFRTAGTGGAQNGTVLLTAANNYTGGTLVNRGSTLRFQTEDSLGSGPITVAGTATAESAADAGPHGTFIGPGPVTFVGGGGVRFVNDAITNAATPTPDRWGDTTPMSLIANTIEMRSRNIPTVASTTTESVGGISYAGGNIINLQRLQAITDHVVQLNVDSLARVGQGTIELARTTGTGAGYGAGQRLIVTNGAPAPVNGMVSPWFMGQNNGPNEFLTYGATGFTPITYDTTVTTGTYPAGTLDYNGTTGGKVLVTTAALTLTDDPTLYALRTEQTINLSGTNDTITLRSGGLALRNPTDNTTLTVSPNILANDGTNNIELVVNTTGGTGRNHQINGTITANGLTKFGVGPLNLTANNATTLTGTVAVNQGTLQLFGPTVAGNHSPAGTGTIELAGGQLNLRSNATTAVAYTLQNNGIALAAGIPIATVDVNRGDGASTNLVLTINPVAASSPGLVLNGAPGVQGQTLNLIGGNGYSLLIGTNALNTFNGNVTLHTGSANLTLNNNPTISGINPVITKSGGNSLIVGVAGGTRVVSPGTKVLLNDGTLELRSVIAFGTGDTTSFELNRGTLNLRRDSAGSYGTTGSGTRYPLTVNGNTTISTDRAGGSATNFAEGLGQLTLNGNPVLTFNSGNGIYPEFVAPAGNPAVRLNGLPILVSNVGPGGVDSAVRFNGQVAGGGFIKLGGGHIHLLGADSPYDGGTYINQGIVRARAANALGTGPVFLNPGGVIDFNATNNLRATQPMIVRGNSTFLPMISVNTDIPHPTANVDVSGAPLGIIGLSNTPGGTYNTPINMATLYGGNWSLGGISSGAYDARYTATTLGAGAGNTYRLGGGGLAFVLGVDIANAAQNNVLTGPNNAVFGIDSGNLRGANTTTFQMVVGGTNDYSGGSTLINRGTVTRLTAANDGVRSGLSNSAVNVFGNLVLGSTSSLVAGAGNTNAVTLHSGAALHFDNNNGGGGGTGSLAAANVLDRWNDATPIALNGALVDLIGTTDQVSSETVGDVTYGRGARIRVARAGTTGTATLTMNNLLGAGPGNTLTLQTSAAGTLGSATSDRLIVTNAPPVPTNGMVSPSIVNATDNTFVTYGANGFANVTYDKTVNATYAPFSLLPTDKVDVVTAALTLNDNPTVYALRTSQSINIGGPHTTMTIRSGGFIATAGTIQPHLVFNDGASNVEARIYNSGTVTINGTITANGITKFGTGNLTINVPQRQYASGWTVNAGTLQINDLEGLGQSVAGNAITLNGTQTTGGSVAQALGITQLILNRNTESPELGIFTGGPITVVNEGTLRIAANADNRNLQSPPVTLQSTGASSVGFTFDVPNNRYRGIIPTLTLLSDATIRVLDSGSTGDTGRITAGVVSSLVGNNVRLNKIGNRTLELGNNAASFLGGSIVVSQGTVRVLDNGALGSATTTATIERNATLEIGVGNFLSTATVSQLPGSIERWNVEDARPAIYNLPAGVNLQLNTNVTGIRTIGLNGGSLEGFLWTDHPASAVVRTVGSGVTVNLLANSSIGQNVLQGPGYDAGRQPTVGQPFGDNITGAQLRIDGNITGAFDLTKTGLDTVTLAGTGNAYNNTIIDAGTLRIGATNALPSARVLTTRLAGTFDLFGFDQTVGGLGAVTGGPDPGGVAVGSSGRILNSGVTDNTLRVNNTADYTYNGTIERNVALTKAGAGALTLGGANTYVGDTTIQAGTLILTGVISGTRTVEVQAGATFDVSGVPGGYTLGAAQTLEGNGNVIGNVNIDGTISPGASPGTLTLSGSADFNNGSTLALEIDSASAFDKLVANGVTLDGVVNLTINLGYVPPASPPTTFLVVDNTSASPIGGTTGFFTWNGPEGLLTEGEHFMVGGQDFSITYLGGVGGNDVLLSVPEPTSATLLLASLGMAAGLQRFRRRSRA